MIGFPSLVNPAEISVSVLAGGTGIFCTPDVFVAMKCEPAMRSVRPSRGELGFTHTLLASSGKSASLVQFWPASRERNRPKGPLRSEEHTSELQSPDHL